VFATETSPCARDGADDMQTNSMIQTAVIWRRPHYHEDGVIRAVTFSAASHKTSTLRSPDFASSMILAAIASPGFVRSRPMPLKFAL